MARSLYRLYLYIIFVALVIFAVVVTAQLLSTLFAFTPLGGAYHSPPTQATLIQALVFAAIGWLISGALGALHYWLIRRDLNSDPAAGTSAIRSFFLNMTEAVGILIAVPLLGFVVLWNWAYNGGGDVSSAVGITLPMLAMVIGLELERRRIPTRKGAALVFQRIHFFGVQFLLFLFLTTAILNSFRPLVDILFFGGRGECAAGYCSTYQIAGLGIMQIWFLLCWLIYSLLTSRDSSRLVRMIMHSISLALSMSWLLYGIFVMLEVIIAPLFHILRDFNDILGNNAAYNFSAPLAIGLISTIVYHLLLRDITRRHLIARSTLRLSEGAIAAVLLASVFWWGCGTLLYNLLQTLVPAPTAPDGSDWVVALALLITGLGYIPLDLLIRHSFVLDSTSALGPRRGLVLALLGVGILACAIGGVTALYSWGTALLGSPLDNWPQITHSGLAATTIGIILVGIYVWPLRGERLLVRQNKPVEPSTPAPTDTAEIAEISAPATIESILDELLAGHITRDEAARRIHSLYGLTTLLA